MIDLRAIVKGESDAGPLDLVVTCKTEYEEMILMNSVKAAELKLARGVKLNVHESLLLYFACIVNGLRERRSVESINATASAILSTDSVLIGVPESLREIRVVAIADMQPETTICLENPIRKPVGYSQ